jgi:hypothetical protein
MRSQAQSASKGGSNKCNDTNKLRDQAGCGLERSSSLMLVLAFKSEFLKVHFLCGFK